MFQALTAKDRLESTMRLPTIYSRAVAVIGLFSFYGMFVVSGWYSSPISDWIIRILGFFTVIILFSAKFIREKFGQEVKIPAQFSEKLKLIQKRESIFILINAGVAVFGIITMTSDFLSPVRRPIYIIVIAIGVLAASALIYISRQYRDLFKYIRNLEA